MKKSIIYIAFALITTLAIAGPDFELGPNNGRIIELSPDKSIRGEVTLKEGNFHVTLLDKANKPVEISDKVMEVSAGTRQNVEKVEVIKTGSGFSFREVPKGQTLGIQIKDNAEAKPFTARVVYDGHFFERHSH
jgi:hypothetical protein